MNDNSNKTKAFISTNRWFGEYVVEYKTRTSVFRCERNINRLKFVLGINDEGVGDVTFSSG